MLDKRDLIVTSKQISPVFFDILLISTISIFLIAPLLQPYCFKAHDVWGHLLSLTQIDRGVKDGQYYVRWYPDLGDGYGYPMGNYYPPLVGYISEAFHLLGLDYIKAIKLTIILSSLLAGIFIYLLGRAFWGRSGGIICAATYLYCPYHIVDLYVRSALAEYLAMSFLPIIVLCAYKLVRTHRLRYLAGGAVAYALLILSHNITAILFTYFLSIYIPFLLITNPSKHLAASISVALAGLLGLGLSTFFWLPAIYEMSEVDINFLYQGGYLDFHNHFVYLNQLFSPFWSYGASVTDIFDDMSFQIGVIPLLFYIFSWPIFLKIEREEKDVRLHMIFFLLIIPIIIYATTAYSTPLWESIPFIRFTQYPWRLLAFVSLNISFLSGCLLYYLDKKIASLGKLPQIILITLIILTSYQYCKVGGYLREDSLTKIIHPNEIAKSSMLVGREYLPIKAKQTLPYNPNKIILLSGNAAIDKPFRRAASLGFRADVSQKANVKIGIFWFPGWTYYLDGKKRETGYDKESGLILIEIPEGRHEILLKFEDTPIRGIGKIISFASLGLLLLIPIIIGFANKDKRIIVKYLKIVSVTFVLIFFVVVAIKAIKISSHTIQELANDDGLPEWRCFLANTDDIVQKIIELPTNILRYDKFNLAMKIYGAEIHNSTAKHTYKTVVKVDDKIVKIYSGEELEIEPNKWKIIPLEKGLIAGKKTIVISLYVTGKPDDNSNYVNILGDSDAITRLSTFNGKTNDLSPDPGQQTGEYLIRLQYQ
jgi:hypothetical protein